MNNTFSICAIIVTYEPNDSLIRLYKSIENQVDEILIVDNNSSSVESINVLKSLKDNKIQLIYNKENFGIGYALNQGVKYAIDKNYKWVLTLDQDSEFLPNTYNLLISSYENLDDKNKIMLIAPKSIERINLKNINNNLPIIENIKWNNVILNLTSGSLIKVETFNKVGMFDEKLFIEQVDNDLCYRIIQKGYFIKVAEDVCFIQEIGNAKKVCGCVVRNHNSKRKYYLSRNVTIMLKKYFFVAPYTTIRYFLGGTLFSFIKVLLFEKEKISKMVSCCKGFFDGLFNIYRNNI